MQRLPFSSLPVGRPGRTVRYRRLLPVIRVAALHKPWCAVILLPEYLLCVPRTNVFCSFQVHINGRVVPLARVLGREVIGTCQFRRDLDHASIECVRKSEGTSLEVDAFRRQAALCAHIILTTWAGGVRCWGDEDVAPSPFNTFHSTAWTFLPSAHSQQTPAARVSRFFLKRGWPSFSCLPPFVCYFLPPRPSFNFHNLHPPGFIPTSPVTSSHLTSSLHGRLDPRLSF